MLRRSAILVVISLAVQLIWNPFAGEDPGWPAASFAAETQLAGPSAEPGPVDDPVEEPVAVADAGGLFAAPQSACRALDAQSIPTDGWHESRSFPGEWLCLSTLVGFGKIGANGLPSNIAFYVTGDNPTDAFDIRVKVNINEPATGGEAMDRLEAAVAKLLDMAGEPFPDALAAALEARRETEVATGFGRALFVHEGGNIDSYKVILIAGNRAPAY